MTIDGRDLIQSLVGNYHSLQLHGLHTNTTWTRRLIGHYDQLGRLLGYWVDYEHQNYDLVWFYREKKGIFFHLEHENAASYERIVNHTIENRLFPSEARITMGIFYPKHSGLLKRRKFSQMMVTSASN
ncbi:MAG: hypothetical protein ACFFD4_37875 [Candidatus Odinarchaeota archaeon]